jgi:hypothetical protein
MKHVAAFALAVPLALCATFAEAGSTPDADGVRAAEQSWSEAFISGDRATLDALLDQDYVSVGSNGVARPKKEIIRLATEYAKAHPGQHAQDFPATSEIRVIGDAAVVQHRNPADSSVDVFYFRDGRWHAWYSQHTKKSTPAGQ